MYIYIIQRRKSNRKRGGGGERSYITKLRTVSPRKAVWVAGQLLNPFLNVQFSPRAGFLM